MKENSMNDKILMLANTLVGEFGLEASLNAIKEMVNEGSVTQKEYECVKMILRNVERNNVNENNE